MRMSKLKELYHRCDEMNGMNDVLIDKTIEALSKDSLTKEERELNADNLKRELESRENFGKVKSTYMERKAENRGWLLGVVGCMIGTCIVEAGPNILKKLKKK